MERSKDDYSVPKLYLCRALVVFKDLHNSEPTLFLNMYLASRFFLIETVLKDQQASILDQKRRLSRNLMDGFQKKVSANRSWIFCDNFKQKLPYPLNKVRASVEIKNN